MDNELAVWGKTVHPYIMRVHEMLHDAHHYYIISEFMANGNLFDFIFEYNNTLKKGKLKERDIADISRQIFLALNYMHKQHMVHRDLKPENILMESAKPGEV